MAHSSKNMCMVLLCGDGVPDKTSKSQLFSKNLISPPVCLIQGPPRLSYILFQMFKDMDESVVSVSEWDPELPAYTLIGRSLISI